jgi:hypothetical protein
MQTLMMLDLRHNLIGAEGAQYLAANVAQNDTRKVFY